MKLVAGLGNPGERYRGTRHNVGFAVVDGLVARHGLGLDTGPAEALQAKWRVAGDVVLLVKPLTFMNVSGQAVAAVCRYYRIEAPDVLIVCDDVNLPLGRLRARANGSEGGHNGLRSIAEHLGTIEYARLRIGVGRGDARRDLADHVLARFEADEQAAIDEAVGRSLDAVETWVERGMGPVMNAFNRAPGEADGKSDDGNEP
jgi:PTH1 family peptidyl-tRNA hydrolase